MKYKTRKQIEVLVKFMQEGKLQEQEESHCVVCNGSGEGSYDGSTCSNCKGLGIKTKENGTNNTRNQRGS
jgi:DnaJ-class molecular chaperone